MDEVCSWILVVKSKKEQWLIATGFAAVFWVIWKTRNEACFKNIFPGDPAALINRKAALLHSWNGLQKTDLRVGKRKVCEAFGESFDGNLQ
jgi:hypothetical protein